jgi:hypothetical protein
LQKQPPDLHSSEAALFCAREIAEELGEAVILYFIDMAIAEAKMKSPPTAHDHKPGARSHIKPITKKTDISFRARSSFIV